MRKKEEIEEIHPEEGIPDQTSPELPSTLQRLRELFIDRVIHRNMEQWQEDVRELSKFNIRETDDRIKWKE